MSGSGEKHGVLNEAINEDENRIAPRDRDSSTMSSELMWCPERSGARSDLMKPNDFWRKSSSAEGIRCAKCSLDFII